MTRPRKRKRKRHDFRHASDDHPLHNLVEDRRHHARTRRECHREAKLARPSDTSFVRSKAAMCGGGATDRTDPATPARDIRRGCPGTRPETGAAAQRGGRDGPRGMAFTFMCPIQRRVDHLQTLIILKAGLLTVSRSFPHGTVTSRYLRVNLLAQTRTRPTENILYST